MRAAGCVINDFADRDIDPHVQAHARPAAGRAPCLAAEALVLFVVLSAAALWLVTRLNRLHREARLHRRGAHRLLSRS